MTIIDWKAKSRQKHFLGSHTLGISLLIVVFLAMLGWSARATSQTSSEHRYLYIAVDDAVKIFNIDANHQYVRKISLPGYLNPRGMRANVATQRLYVAYKSSPAGPSLVAIDLTNDRVLWKKPFTPDADAISITPDGSTIYMASGETTSSDYFFVLDAATGTIKDYLHIHPGTHNTIVSLDGKHVYITSLDFQTMYMFDTRSHEKLMEIGPFSAGIRPFTINGRETLAFVNVNYLQGFEVADLTTGKVLHRVEVQGFPYTPDPRVLDPSHGVGLTPDEREVWVAGATNYVHVFDATVMPPRQVASIRVNRVPKWVTFSLDGRYMYCGSGEVIDTQTRQIVATYPSTKRQLEIDFVDNTAIRANDIYGVGKVVDAPPIATTSPTLVPATATLPTVTLAPVTTTPPTTTQTPTILPTTPTPLQATPTAIQPLVRFKQYLPFIGH